MLTCLGTITSAQSQRPSRVAKRVWQTGNKGVGVALDGVRLHEPAFIGEDRMRAFLRFLNTSRAAVFVQAFDLTSTLGDGALLHDVFGEKQCRSVEKGSGVDNNPGGALGLGYSRLDTSTIVEVAPGSSISFSVPLDHLSRGRCVRIRYWIGSERRPSSEAEYQFLWFGASTPL
jgi:hypothetical protein